MSEMEPIDRQPESGEICPACGHTDAIMRETTIRPIDETDLAGVWMFGTLGYITAITGRKTVRLRCERCDCRFATGGNALAAVFWWLIITAIVTAPFAALATIGAPYIRGSHYLLDRVSEVCQFGITHPMSVLLAILIPALSAAITMLYITMNRRYERAQLIRAVAKRDR